MASRYWVILNISCDCGMSIEAATKTFNVDCSHRANQKEKKLDGDSIGNCLTYGPDIVTANIFCLIMFEL